MSNRQASDSSARRAALNPQQSFAIRAPAGSGKTELLTQRVMSLLAYCEKPEEILAITFTKKSAAEMRERILAALRRAQDPATPNEEHDRFTWELAKKALKRSEQQQWALLENPNRLRIQTIDSFCRFLSSQQPVSSQLGTLPDTLDDASKTEQALRQAFRETLHTLNMKNQAAAALKNVLLHFDNDVMQLEKLIVSMLAKRDQWLEHILQLTDEDSIQESNQLLIEHLLQQAFDALKPWQGQITDYFNHAVDNYSASGNEKVVYLSGTITQFPEPLVENLVHWRDIFTFLTTKDGLRKPKGLNTTIGIPSESSLKKEIQDFFGQIAIQPGLEDILLFSKQVPDHPVSKTQLAITQDIRSVLLFCVANLKLIFNQMRATDYTEIALAALDALGSEGQPSDLSLKLDYRLKHILVDEFQDTSHLQLQLLKKLTAGWQPDDGHSLFIVGDAMQSCYSFRNADVRIFLDVMKEGIGGLPLITLTLTENFRSETSIVEWNNQIFSRAFPNEVNINLSAVPYNPSTAFNPAQRLHAVQCYGVSVPYTSGSSSDDEEEKQDYELAEAEKIVGLIKEIRKNNPAEKIAILVRSRNHAQTILPLLKVDVIPWQATDMDKLNKRMAIIDLKTLTRALLYPADHLAWLALLRSPMAGLSLADLLALSEYKDDVMQQELPIIVSLQKVEAINRISSSGQKILQRISPILLRGLAQQLRKPLRQWIEGIWYTLGGPAACDPKQLVDCENFFDLLEKVDDCGQITDWGTLETAIDKLYANDPCTDLNPVQIMTIHKSKGLEFDHVMLPGLAKKARNNESELFMWNDYLLNNDQQVLVFGPALEKGADKDDRHINFLKTVSKKKQDYETLRLLYVACTRAKKNLYLFGSITMDKDGGKSRPSKNSLLYPIWEDFDNQCTIIENSVTRHEKMNQAAHTLEHIRRLPASYTLPTLPEYNDLASYRGHEYDDDKNIPELTSLVNFVARQTGTVIHKCLQQIATKGLFVWKSGDYNYRRENWQSQLHQLRVPQHLINKALDEIDLAVTTVTESKQGQWILDSTHKNSNCELALSFNGKISVIDRTFIDKNVRWIIDYKTAKPGENQAIEEFLTEQLCRYKNQLQSYQLLLKKMEDRPVNTALYFPQLDKLVIV